MIKFSKLLILVLISNIALADSDRPDNFCTVGVDVKQIESLELISKFTPCSGIENSEDRCDCIQFNISKADGEKSEVGSFAAYNLMNQVNKDYDKLQEIGEENKKKYYQQYSEIYKMMTSHSVAQKTVLGLETTPASIGCTPLAMAKGIKLKMSTSIDTQITALTSFQKTSQDYYSRCIAAGGGESCHLNNNKANLLGKRIESMKALKDGKFDDNCQVALNVLGDTDSINSLKKYLVILKDSPNFRGEMRGNSMGKALLGMSSVILKAAGVDGSALDLGASLKKEGLTCGDFIAASEKITSAYKNEFAKNIQGGAAIASDLEKYSPEKQCRVMDMDMDPICVAYALKNQQLMISNAELYSPPAEAEDSCLSYAEFVTYKGMPSARLLREFSSTDHPEKLLEDTAGWLGHGRDADKKAFLRANPLIMQLAQMKEGNPSPAVRLGQALKKMAKDMKGNKKEGEAGKFSRYLDFMKGEGGLKAILESDGALATKRTCNDLQNTFTAISLSNEVAKVNTKKMKTDESANFSCVAQIYENTESSNLDASLKESELYRYGEKLDGMPSEKEYKKFKEENCSKIAAFKAQGCLFEDSKRCNQNNPKMKMVQGQIERHGVSKYLSPQRLAKANSNLDQNSQDPVFDKIYDREVTSKLNHNVLALADDKGEFHTSMVNNAKIQSQSNVTEMYHQEKNGFVPSSSNASNKQQSFNPIGQVDGFESNKENPGQVRPVFDSPSPVSQAPIADFDKFSSKKISEAAKIEDLDPDFYQRPVEEKLSTYKALKDYVSEGGVPPKFSPSEELKELEKSLEESKIALKDLENDKEEEKEDKEAKVAQAQTSSSPAASRAPANFQQASFVAPISNAPVLGQFPGSRAAVGSEAKLSNAEASYQAALMHKYDMNPSLQILVQGNDAVVKAPYDISVNNVLKTDDVYPFSALNDPKKLSEFLAVKVGGSVKDGESVKIVDPASNSYFLLKATVKDGVTSYQRYPFVSEKDIRIVKLGDLNNTLKLNK